MNVIEKSVSNVLINELESLKLTNLSHFNSGNALINHKLLYCNKWSENKYEYLVKYLTLSFHLKDYISDKKNIGKH